MSSLPAPQFNQFKINEPGLNTTFKDSPGTSRQGMLAQLSSPIGLGVLFLVVAIAAILVWPVKPLFGNKPQASNEAAEPVMAMEPPVPASASTVVDDGVGVAPSTTQQVAPVVVDNPTAAVGKEESGVPSNPASSPGSVNNTEEPSQPALLELIGHGESWVQVTDGAGQPKLRKLIQNGEVLRVTGQLPLSVVVGRADNVSVAVRGKPMDLAPLARVNVARFEVK
jgi:cytoskeleton protein RodZ